MIDELKNIKSDSSFIPEGCASFVEESVFIVGAIDEDFDDLMESFNISEGEDCAPEAEPDTEPVEDTNESAVVTESAKDLGGKVVEFLKGIWAKVKGIFEKIIKWIDERKSDAKAKGLDKLSAKWDKVEFKADAKLGSFHAAKNIADTKVYPALTRLITDSANRAVGDSDASMPTNILKAVGINASDGTDVKTMRNKLKEHFLGSEVISVTGANISKVKSDVIAILGGDQKKVVKDAYNAARKSVDSAIADVKKAAKEYEGKDKDVKGRLAGNVKSVKRYGQLLATVVSVQTDAIRKQNAEAFGIAMRVKAKLAKKEGKAEKKEEPKTEAVDIFAW